MQVAVQHASRYKLTCLAQGQGTVINSDDVKRLAAESRCSIHSVRKAYGLDSKLREKTLEDLIRAARKLKLPLPPAAQPQPAR
jgi:ribosomal protein L12E/L44/L45/RPP1/RPP2